MCLAQGVTSTGPDATPLLSVKTWRGGGGGGWHVALGGGVAGGGGYWRYGQPGGVPKGGGGLLEHHAIPSLQQLLKGKCCHGVSLGCTKGAEQGPNT